MVACRMIEETNKHLPVLLAEVLDNLAINPNGVYVDATFGRGGHSAAILEQLGAQGRLIALDKDPSAVAVAKQRFGSDTRFMICHGSFTDLQKVLEHENLFGKVSGILFDLGVSSPQLDEPDRGFSFMRDGKLDMRMNTAAGVDAATWLATVSEEDLTRILFEYGEEKFSRRIARSIIEKRVENPITTTKQLAEIVSAAIPKWQKGKHPATRSFQAIRIEINHELDELKAALAQSLEALAITGRLVVISFHSLEDRLVKRFIQQHESGGDFPPGLPVKQEMLRPRLKRIGRAIMPTEQETEVNPRARSAVLRIAEKLL